jgi:hypothetical protein
MHHLHRSPPPTGAILNCRGVIPGRNNPDPVFIGTNEEFPPPFDPFGSVIVRFIFA